MSAAADWDMKCPKCGSTGPFRIDATAVFLVYADGTEQEDGGVEFDGGSYCECTECDHSSIVSDFETE